MSETDPMTLTAFLLARIAEDEGTARAVSGWDEACAGWWGDLAAHAARHDPARVLAECESKRRIVELHAPLDGGDPEMYPWTDEFGRTYWPECAECSEKHVDGRGCATLRILALPYASHPDFRPEWRPTSPA